MSSSTETSTVFFRVIVLLVRLVLNLLAVFTLKAIAELTRAQSEMGNNLLEGIDPDAGADPPEGEPSPVLAVVR